MSASEATIVASEIQKVEYRKEIQIAAPAEIVFETILQPVGPFVDQKLKIEPWPGGRWFRDLGDNTGHFWGHVQVIKPPKLLELCGPMMMSYPATSFVQYRLTEEAGGTKLALVHQAIGLIKPEHMQGFPQGWGAIAEAIKSISETKAKR
jgi:uncharacterized protein YndB with AHSA1/START domain